jgi:hypothetical protein
VVWTRIESIIWSFFTVNIIDYRFRFFVVMTCTRSRKRPCTRSAGITNRPSQRIRSSARFRSGWGKTTSGQSRVSATEALRLVVVIITRIVIVRSSTRVMWNKAVGQNTAVGQNKAVCQNSVE